jgi:cytochrome c oxidase assembly protein subunit 15
MHLLGIAVAGPDSFTRCLGWPLGVLDADRWPALQWLRLGLALAAAVLIVLTAVAAATRARTWPALCLLLAEVVLGFALLAGAGGVGVRTAYAVVASLLFGAVAWLAGTTSVRTVVAEPALITG